MIRKPLCLALAGALALVAAGPVPARAASEQDIARMLAGLAALAIVGKALSDATDDGARDRPKRVQRPQHDKTVAPRCLRTFERQDGLRRVVMKRCTQRSVGRPDLLPRECLVRVRTANGPRRAYGGRCMRQHGYRLGGT
ncbi:hypothetical protein [Rhodosalinus sp.]|uniref:hypothetical protein n=1 Tax=Rhodosalinus sp. TaxID=2047741 RepID=UPI0035632421